MLQTTNRERIQLLRDKAVRPVISYDHFRLRFWENYLENMDRSMETRYAEAYAAAMAAEQPVIEDGELIVGKANIPLNEEEQHRWEELLPRTYEACPMVGQDSHMAVDFELLLKKGISGILKDIAEKRAGDITPEQAAFYDSCTDCLKSVADFSDRYADLAAKLAKQCDNPERKAELEQISAICSRVPRYPAESFYEAVQAAHFICYVLSYDPMRRCWQQFQLGRPDQYLYPYYLADKEKGILTDEFAQTLLDCLAIQINNRVPNGLSCGYMLGGRNPAGQAVFNELTMMGMEVIADNRLVYPSVGLCYTPEMPEQYLRRGCEILSTGASHPAIFNEDIISEGLQYYGVPAEESHSYIHSTCVEITPVASSNVWVASPYHNLTGILLDVLKTSYDTMDQLVEAYFAEVDRQVKTHFELHNQFRTVRRECSLNPLLSCLVNDCLSLGVDIERGGARYNWIMPSFVGMANLIDSLTVIDRLVYRERKYSMDQLMDLVGKDFQGCETQRLEILNRISKYGNDEEESDRWSILLTRNLVEICSRYTPMYSNGKLIPSVFCWVQHAALGGQTGATPDGRKAGFPFGDGSGAAQGREHHGPTASILSSTKWSHKEFIGGVAVNLKFSRKMFGPDSMEKMLSIVRTYMERGGFEMQINVVDRDTLVKARKNPESYQDLVVRIGGYSDYFVKLSSQMQEELLLRTEHEI